MSRNAARRRYFATPELKRSIRRQGRLASWFAQQIGVTQGHFSHVLYGRRDVSEAHAQFITTVLGADFDLLWNVSGESEPASERTQEAIAS